MSVGRRQWAVIAAICAVVALLAWYALARAGSGGPDDGGVGPGADPSASPTATLFPPVAAAGSVLSPLDPAAAQPDAAVLASVLAPFLTDEDLGSRVTASVVDAATGAVLLDQQAQLALTPASTAKLMTGLAALDVLGPERRVATSVVTGASADQIVLVGRGDSMLATSATPPEAYPQRASLDDLAARTAAALVARGLTSVSLGYDAGFFAGPLANPSW